jgi:hypothetical protein
MDIYARAQPSILSWIHDTPLPTTSLEAYPKSSPGIISIILPDSGFLFAQVKMRAIAPATTQSDLEAVVDHGI